MVREAVSIDWSPALCHSLPQPFEMAERMGEQPIARRLRAGIDPRRGVPEQALIDQPAAEIPDGGCQHAAGPRDAPHLGDHGSRVGDEVQNQLGQRPGEISGIEGQSGGIGEAEVDPFAAAPLACEGDIGLGAVDGGDPAAAGSGQRARQIAGAAADIEHRSLRPGAGRNR